VTKPSPAFGMLNVEGDSGSLALYRLMVRQAFRLLRFRMRLAWKVLRGRHDLTDAMHMLACEQATRSLARVVKAERRLFKLRTEGGTAQEVDLARIAYRMASAAFNERYRTNDWYQDTNQILGIHIRYPARERTR
jgi:hypothetical protein